MFRKKNPLIFVVDNNPDYQKLISTLLKTIKLNNIKSFNDGESCYMESTDLADVVILDYNLGVGNWNGLEFMEEYHRLNASAEFFFMSSNTKIDVAVESVQKGAFDYIVKSKEGLSRLLGHLSPSNKIIKKKDGGRRNLGFHLFYITFSIRFFYRISIIYGVI